MTTQVITIEVIRKIPIDSEDDFGNLQDIYEVSVMDFKVLVVGLSCVDTLFSLISILNNGNVRMI